MTKKFPKKEEIKLGVKALLVRLLCFSSAWGSGQTKDYAVLYSDLAAIQLK